MNALIIFAKNPNTTPVKTRLAKSIGKTKATALYKGWLDTLITKHQHQKYKVILYVKGGTSYFKKYKLPVKSQTGKDLGMSMLLAFEQELPKHEKVALIGSDLPDIEPSLIHQAFSALDKKDIVLGPAKDGGYYLVAMTSPHNIFSLTRWSHGKVLRQTLRLLKKQSLTHALLKTMRDIDTVADLKQGKISGRIYDYADYFWEKMRYQRIRPLLWQHVIGEKILDVGVGTGRNIPFYPKTRVTGIDISPAMLERAKKRAKKHNVRVSLHTMDVTHLRYPDNSFDSVVATFVLCVMDRHHEKKAVHEIFRVLKPGGRFCMFNYQYSQHALRRYGQKLFAPLIKLLYGVHLTNPILDDVKKHFKIILETPVYADTLRMIVAEKK